MIGLGTIVNGMAVLLGGLIGFCIRGGVPDRIKDSMVKACGLSVLFIGIGGALQEMMALTDAGIRISGTIMIVCSLAIGTLLGEIINIEKYLDRMGKKLKKMAHAEGDSQFVDGFVTVTLIICVGAMAIMGSIQDGLMGDYSTLFAKSILDGIIVLVFTSSMGIGPIFSVIPLVLYQGSITLLAVFVSALLTESMIAGLSMVGSVLIFAVGVNLVFEKTVKVGNMLPAIFVPVVYEVLRGLL